MTSILRIVRRNQGYSVPQLSFLTGISQATLRYYELDNEHLYKASGENLSCLLRVLKADPSVFRRHSFFNPISRIALLDGEFAEGLTKSLCAYYSLPYQSNFVVFFEKGQGYQGLYIGTRNEFVAPEKTIFVADELVENLVFDQTTKLNGEPSLKRLLY